MTSPVISGPDLASLAVSLVVVVAAVVLIGWLYSRMRFSSGGAGRKALRALRRARTVNPRLKNLKERIRELEQEFDQKI